MPMTMTTRSATALVLAAALFAAPACTEESGSSDKAMAKLVDEVREAQRLNGQLVERLDRLERKMDGFRQDVDRLGREKIVEALDIQNAAAEGAAEGEAALGEASAMGGDELAAMLASEDGKAAVAKAMEAIEQKRNDERRDRMVSAMVDRFAEQANLSAAQTEDVSRILGDSMKKIGDVWSSMRSMGEMTPEQRATLREENMMKMEEIRLATDDEMKAVLDSSQFGIYEEQAQRMRGFGGRRGGGGR
jgi:hypothetical protein